MSSTSRHSSSRSTSACALLFCAAASGQSALNVVVIANRASGESRQIAEYYQKSRRIPADHLCLIQTPPVESVPRDVYMRDIEQPVRQCLEHAPLSQRPVWFLVTTKGVPLRILGTHGADGTAASVDSELAALYARRRNPKLPIEGALPNPFYRQIYAPFNQKRFPLYMVARLAAFDLKTVLGMIDRAAAAQNRGRFVFDLKEGPSLNDGDSWLAAAAAQLPSHRVRIDSSKSVLAGETLVIGYGGWGSNDPARTRRKLGFTWLAGSIASEFVSSNARTLVRPPDSWTFGVWKKTETYFAGSPQSLAADSLDEGATAATGHTDEPFLRFTPRPDLLFPAYYSGRTLGESYYASLPALSWTNVLLGDPLTRLGPPKP